MTFNFEGDWETEVENSLGETRDVREIWDIIAAGQHIEVEFSTTRAANNFRIRLHQIKTANEKHQIDVGFLSEEDVQSIVFSRRDPTPEELVNYKGELVYIYHVYLSSRRREPQKFKIKLLPPNRMSS